MKSMEVTMDIWWSDQALHLEKKKEKNKKVQGKGILDRSFFVLALKTLSGCECVKDR
jgi:hypothetical protein